MSERNFEHYLKAHRDLTERKIPFVTVTLVHTLGESPNQAGARMIVDRDGLRFGTVGGGKLEKRAMAEALAELSSPKPRACFFAEWNLQKDLGMTCGGVAKLYFEVFQPQSRWKIAVFGAGHVSQALCPLLLTLDCDVACIDPRAEWLDKLPEHPALKKVMAEDMTKPLLELPSESFVVLITMGHSTDAPLLVKALQERDFPYLGVMGSTVKSRRLRQDVLDAGLAASALGRYLCPIGEDFGSNAPAEIAFSIVAQLLRRRDELARIETETCRSGDLLPSKPGFASRISAEKTKSAR